MKLHNTRWDENASRTRKVQDKGGKVRFVGDGRGAFVRDVNYDCSVNNGRKINTFKQQRTKKRATR